MEDLRFTKWHRIYPSGDDIVTNHLAPFFETVWGLALSPTESARTDASGANLSCRCLSERTCLQKVFFGWQILIALKQWPGFQPDTNQVMVNMRRSCLANRRVALERGILLLAVFLNFERQRSLQAPLWTRW
jgi:hypothetical protein